MDEQSKESQETCFRQAEESHYKEISKLCDAENWGTPPEYIHLASKLPSATHIALSGAEVIGLFTQYLT